jgi:PTS system mannitol-specific IIC component
VIVTHKNLLERTRLAWPEKRIVTINEFMKDSNLDDLLAEIKEQ